MEEYANNGNDSGVLRYKLGEDYIVVEFGSGDYTFYKYSYSSPGKTYVDVMKELARNGEGLNEYINRDPAVRNGYQNRGNSLSEIL